MHQPALGKKIVQLRKRLNLTQEELAKRSSLGLRTIQRIESGGVMPRNSTIDLLLNTLGVDRESLMIDQPPTNAQNRFARFFLSGVVSHNALNSSIQTAWIAGILYFMMLILENGLDYVLFIEDEVQVTFKVSYFLVKLSVLFSYSLFMRGFIVLSQLFENTLLRVSAYVLIGAMASIVFSDIIKVFLIGNEILIIVLTIGQSIIAGITSIIFGVVLFRLQDSLGVLSKYSGIVEITLGSCFVLIIFSPIALALLVPATILEIIILFKGGEFIKVEILKES